MMTDPETKNTRNMFHAFREYLVGADRVVIETKNALGEMDAHYIHAPTLLEGWPKVAPLVWQRNGQHWAGGYGYVIRATGKRFTLTSRNNFGTDFQSLESAKEEAFARHQLETMQRFEVTP